MRVWVRQGRSGARWTRASALAAVLVTVLAFPTLACADAAWLLSPAPTVAPAQSGAASAPLVDLRSPVDAAAAPAGAALADLPLPLAMPVVVGAAGAAALAAPWRAQLQAAATESGIDADLLEALVAVESNFNPRAVSHFGAVGLMQVMPSTAGAVLGLPVKAVQAVRQKLLDPSTNLHVGAQYLRQLMDRFSNQIDLVLAAYNAGVGNVLKAGGRVPPNRETPGFVEKVRQRYASLQAAAAVRLGVAQASPPSSSPASLPSSSPLETSMPHVRIDETP